MNNKWILITILTCVLLFIGFYLLEAEFYAVLISLIYDEQYHPSLFSILIDQGKLSKIPLPIAIGVFPIYTSLIKFKFGSKRLFIFIFSVLFLSILSYIYLAFQAKQSSFYQDFAQGDFNMNKWFAICTLIPFVIFYSIKKN